jgi:glycosyltransferase involved in cell wall biosynthesis
VDVVLIRTKYLKNKIRLKNICVAHENSSHDFALYATAVDALQELGYNVCASEKREDFVKSDAVLIISGPRYPNQHLESLAQLKGDKPAVILWQIDPVPPPEFTKKAERTGILMQKFNIKYRLGGKKGKLFKHVFPFSRELSRAVRWLLSLKLERQVQNIDGYGIMPSEGSEWNRLMERYLTLKKYLDLGVIDYCFTSGQAREKFFRSRGIDIPFIPFGYHPQFGRKLELNRDIDVLFLGRINNKRRNILVKKIFHNLREKSVSFTIMEDIYGDARTELLNRAKIVLDIPRVPWETGGVRFLMAMSCGALVVSSTLKYLAPYEPGIHFVNCSEQNIADSILYYLSNDSQRQKIVDDAYRFVTTEITVTKMMSKIMEKCNAYPSF